MGADSGESHDLPGLYAEHHAWLTAWLQRRTGCSHAAADLAQDTFLRVLVRRLPDRLLQPRAFLVRIAQGLLVDAYRHAAVERAYLEQLAALPEPVQPSPETQLQVLQALREIERMMAGLSAKARAAFVLSRIEGLGHDEIARSLGVSKARVSQYLAQAMACCYEALYGAALP